MIERAQVRCIWVLFACGGRVWQRASRRWARVAETESHWQVAPLL